MQLKDQAEIVIVISAADIEKNKVRGDLGITYDTDVLPSDRRIPFQSGFTWAALSSPSMPDSASADSFQQPPGTFLGIRVYTHYRDRRLSGQHSADRQRRGLRQRMIISRRPVPWLSLPLPGRAAARWPTCLSQLYHEHKQGHQGRLRQV